MLKQKLQHSATEALKQGNQEVVGVLRLALSVINVKEKEKRYKVAKERPSADDSELSKGSQLADEEIVEVLFSEIKKRNDAIALYEKGNRPKLAEKEEREIEILKCYLPQLLSEEEVRKLALETINTVGAKEVKDMGRVMASLALRTKGKADMSIVGNIVKELLSK